MKFSRRISKIGINPYVGMPERVLRRLFRQARRSKGPIPVRGRLNRKEFKQTVVKYQGAWRLYLNTEMRLAAGVDVGDIARVDIAFDPRPRVVPVHPLLKRALAKNREANEAFRRLAPSRQKEILRYLHSMKTEESVERNVRKVVWVLSGKGPKGPAFLRAH